VGNNDCGTFDLIYAPALPGPGGGLLANTCSCFVASSKECIKCFALSLPMSFDTGDALGNDDEGNVDSGFSTLVCSTNDELEARVLLDFAACRLFSNSEQWKAFVSTKLSFSFSRRCRNFSSAVDAMVLMSVGTGVVLLVHNTEYLLKMSGGSVW
jgi:hypothetical protein